MHIVPISMKTPPRTATKDTIKGYFNRLKKQDFIAGQNDSPVSAILI
jgi:hypothetical protein